MTTHSNETKLVSMIDDSLRVLIVSGGLFLDGALSRFPGSAVEAALRQRLAHIVHIDIEIDNRLPEILDSFCPDVVFPVNLGESNFILLRSLIKDSLPCVGSDHYQNPENVYPGRAYFVAVLEAPFLRALPPIAEPFDESDMHTMYMGSKPYICPALLPSNTILEVQLAAVEAHLKNGCKDYSCTELRVTEADVVAVGTDTHPFMMPSSLFGMAASAEGIPFVDLCWLLVRQAASRSLGVVDFGFNVLYPGNVLSNFAEHNVQIEGQPASGLSRSNAGLGVCNLQRELREWALDAGVIGANHLAKIRDELEELEAAPDDCMEMADVLLALMLHAERSGVDLLLAGRQKFGLIKGRTYGKPDQRGVVRHIDTPNFLFDGVSCASIEGLIQSLKFEDREHQIMVCSLAGKQAKMRGSERNNAWQTTQTLWWNGIPMARSSAEYQGFLDSIFFTLFDQSEEFKRALAKTGCSILTHSIGKHDPSKTVLTAHELVSRLTFLRKYLLQDKESD